MTSDSGHFSDAERQAIKDRAAELKTDAKRSKRADKAAAAAADQREKIASMPDGDRELAERIHDLVEKNAPDLEPKLYYGQPGWGRDGKPVVFFRSGQMDKERYSTFGVSNLAALDEPTGLWATSWALTDPDETAWNQIADIIRRAASGGE